MKKNLLNLVGIALLLCVSTPVFAQTAGIFTFAFTPISPGTGWYNGQTNRHALAVWIESCTTCGSGTTVGTSTYVRTKIIYWGGSNSNTGDHLPAWVSKSGASTTGVTTSGATLSSFTVKTFTWDGKNAAGTTAMPDGNYRVCIQETWGHGASTVTRYFPFTKGVATDMQTPTADTHFNAISLMWQPTLATDTFSTNPEAVIYPNPTSGVFTIDFKNEVNNIKVINLLGAVILDEKVDLVNAGTSKKIDLSNFSNGMYIVNVSNNTGASTNYKVVVNK
jgi:hypothetical protein